MMTDLSQSTVDQLTGYVNTGNYTQFYATLYASESTISGLYIPGPTGQGIFGNYSHDMSANTWAMRYSRPKEIKFPIRLPQVC